MKPSLLLLHGALGCMEQFTRLREKLEEQYDVHQFNFPGHGGMPIVEPFTIELFVESTLEFLNQHKLSSASIFGYSMGGYVALQLARDHPDKIHRIMTLGTKFNWTPESAMKDVRLMNPELIEQKIPAFAETLRQRHAPEDWKRNMTLTGKMMTALGAGKAMKPEEYNSIHHPVLVCIGTDDHMVTQEESAAVAQQLKNGVLKVIEGFRHPIESVDMDVLSAICIEHFAG